MEQLTIEGMGRPILVLHGGTGDRTSWGAVTDRLRDQFRVGRLHRRQYRLDVPRRVTIPDEVDEVLEAAKILDRPLLVGHSSGAVVALEALLRGDFAGAVLYEPPLVVDRRLGGDAVERARVVLGRGNPGAALAIFLRDVAGMRGPLVPLIRLGVNRKKDEWAPKVERQLDDNDAINALGNRLADYCRIDVPVLLLGGDRSPGHLRERLDALQAVLPNARRVTMHGQAHNAERSAPERLAEIVARFRTDLA